MSNDVYISPDKVLIKLNFDNFVKGSAFFIPCINTVLAANQVRDRAKKKGMKLKSRRTIVGGMSGIRVWRIE